LQTFAKHGIAHAIESIHGGASYALCFADCGLDDHKDEHPHFYCEQCKKVSCSDDFFYTIGNLSASQFVIHNVEVNIKGICPDCLKKP
jgi:Fur family ferric uptake transcriptional regulator